MKGVGKIIKCHLLFLHTDIQGVPFRSTGQPRYLQKKLEKGWDQLQIFRVKPAEAGPAVEVGGMIDLQSHALGQARVADTFLQGIIDVHGFFARRRLRKW
jgi:hypothetical protein